MVQIGAYIGDVEQVARYLQEANAKLTGSGQYSVNFATIEVRGA